MLTRELALAEYDFAGSRILPERLTTGRHRRYREYAERMLAVYRDGIGRTRRELHRLVHEVFAEEPDCPQKRIDAFSKLLDDASVCDGQKVFVPDFVFRHDDGRTVLLKIVGFWTPEDVGVQHRSHRRTYSCRISSTSRSRCSSVRVFQSMPR